MQDLQEPDPSLEREIELAFAPLHKLCLGLATGTATGVLVALLTVVHLLRSPGEDHPLVLLAQYFPGYEVSPVGALLGLAWGFAAGFAAGWFFAFCRNVVVGLAVVVFRARAEMVENAGFLDHI